MGAKNEQTLRRLVSSIKQADRPKTSGYDTQATVRRIEDGIAWVHIPGGVDETPIFSRTVWQNYYRKVLIFCSLCAIITIT